MPEPVRAVLMTTGHGRRGHTVVGPDGLPIEVIDQYLHSLLASDTSTSTLRAYAHHLAHLFRWLDSRGLTWNDVVYDDLADFMYTLKMGLPPLLKRGGGQRQNSSVRACAAAIREFFEFHRLDGRGPTDLRLSREQAFSSRTTYHLLANVEKRRPIEMNRLSSGLARRGDDLVQIINFETDFDRLLRASRTDRDRLLLSGCYDLGLRIGAALGMRHEDIDLARKRVRVMRRTDNVNNALSKRRDTFWVDAPTRFFGYYRAYLLGELADAGIDSDYVFVNLVRPPIGRPSSYGNMYQSVVRIGRVAGLPHLNPHMLRHTHATALAKAGWTSAEIAARLGQQSAATADIYIHLAADDLSARLKTTQHLVWPPLPDRAALAAP